MVVIGHGGGGCAWYHYPSLVLCQDMLGLDPIFKLPGRSQARTMANWATVWPKTPWMSESISKCH